MEDYENRGKNIHVLPINDIIEHIESWNCPCEPKVSLENVFLIIHNALDGRE